MRRVVRIAGVGAVVGGFAVVALGDRLAGLPTSRAIVVIVSLVSVVLGLWYLADRRLRESERAPTPDPEPGFRVPVPGDEFDRAVEQRESTRAIKRRLAERVRASLVERGASREEAEAALEQGAWTDDPVAAAFLATDGRRIPLVTRIRWILRGDTRPEQSVRRTVSALAELREGS